MNYVIVKNNTRDHLSSLLVKVLDHILTARRKRNDAITYYVDRIEVFDDAAPASKIIATSADPSYLEKLFRVAADNRLTVDLYVPAHANIEPKLLKRFSQVIDLKSLFDPVINEVTVKLGDGAMMTETITWKYHPSEWDLSVLRDNGVTL